MYSSPPGRDRFIIDSNFPERLTASGLHCTVDFIQNIFEKYSRCGLTHASDRDTAISGLVKRRLYVYKYIFFCSYLSLSAVKDHETSMSVSDLIGMARYVPWYRLVISTASNQKMPRMPSSG